MHRYVAQKEITTARIEQFRDAHVAKKTTHSCKNGTLTR